MKLIKAAIKNFRLLYDVDITFDENATSVVGKNNSGKTSLSLIFNMFLNENNKKFPFEDFSLKSHDKFIATFEKYGEIKEENKEERIKEIQSEIPKIQLLLTLKYGPEDNWANIKPFFTNLEESDEITILCEYAPDSTEKFLKKLIDVNKNGTDEELIKNIETQYQSYYKINVRPYSKIEATENVRRADLNRLIQAKFIHAQRVLDDSNSESKSKLSKVFQQQFYNENEKDESKSGKLLEIIEQASSNIDSTLSVFFSSFIEYFSSFGYPGMGNEKVELKSQLAPEVLFKNNVKLFYNHDGAILPEKYNGLGYSNLIYIIAQIIGFYSEIGDFQNNLNLIFIEEPEAHMHPQMQSAFIKNINRFLSEVGLNAQVIITTHSPHILSDAMLQSIRYFAKTDNANSCTVKDLMDFNDKLTESETKEFLTQYLTLGKCDLFFADKAILFEGTVERILLPIFIEKTEKATDGNKLSEQYISSIEVGGAYISKFKELLEFLGLKALIITDIDSVEKQETGNRATYHKVMVAENDQLVTSNITLKNWIPGEENILQLLSKSDADKLSGSIRVAYQIKQNAENFKCGRSFEEAFLIDNHQYIFDNKDNLTSITYFLKECLNSDDVQAKSYDIQDFIDRNKKKTEFAFDLLNVNKDDWKVPTYIEEGLEWLSM
ncbi:MAG: ATP-dependent endonuclease [Planctomycetes bacterium B3_Pla]|nr:MAG: ATP-dependent endonuclease [Planctomycetes bacterium B3_Pla]